MTIFIKRYINYISFNIKILFLYKKKYNENIHLEHNNKEKNRIFIIGNGPSLNKTHLHLLKNEIVFCSNRFTLMLERLNFTPDYYICIDDRVLSTIKNDIQKIANLVQYVFLPFVHPSTAFNFFNTYRNLKNVYWLILSKFTYSLNMPFIGINKSVTNCALQIAAYMGFKEIYLLGVDLNYEDHKSVVKENRRDWSSEKDDDPNHFDPRYFGKGKKYHHPRMDETLKKWEEAKEFFERKGVKIYNATVGGNLEIFERVNLKELIGLSDKQEMMLFLKKFDINNYISLKLTDYFPNAPKVQSEHFNYRSYNEFITDTDTAIWLIPQVIYDYIPYGPIFGQYLFIKRKEKIIES